MGSGSRLSLYHSCVSCFKSLLGGSIHRSEPDCCCLVGFDWLGSSMFVLLISLLGPNWSVRLSVCLVCCFVLFSNGFGAIVIVFDLFVGSN